MPVWSNPALSMNVVIKEPEALELNSFALSCVLDCYCGAPLRALAL